MIHCSRRSIFNCPQHKLIAYVSMDFFFNYQSKVLGRKWEGEKEKNSQFSTFQIQTVMLFQVTWAKLTP